MAYPKSKTPEKYCSYCGKKLERRVFKKGNTHRLESMNVFVRRKYCDLTCSAMGRRKEEPSKGCLLKRAQHLKNAECEMCGTAEHLNAHHVDGNRHNNVAQNVMTLCASCHTKWHWEHGKQGEAKTRTVCVICGKQEHGRGYCQKHFQRFKKYGNPRLSRRYISGEWRVVAVE